MSAIFVDWSTSSAESVNLANEFLNLIIPLPRFQFNGGALVLSAYDNINPTSTFFKVGTVGSLVFNNLSSFSLLPQLRTHFLDL